MDLKVVKSMTAEELAANKLTTIGPDGKPKLLSAYKQKKLLLAQQQTTKNPDIIQINQGGGPTKRRKIKTSSEGEGDSRNENGNSKSGDDKVEESYTDQSPSGTAGYIDDTSSNI